MRARPWDVAEFSTQPVAFSSRAPSRRKSTVRSIANRSKEKCAARINTDGVPALSRAHVRVSAHKQKGKKDVGSPLTFAAPSH